MEMARFLWLLWCCFATLHKYIVFKMFHRRVSILTMGMTLSLCTGAPPLIDNYPNGWVLLLSLWPSLMGMWALLRVFGQSKNQYTLLNIFHLLQSSSTKITLKCSSIYGEHPWFLLPYRQTSALIARDFTSYNLVALVFRTLSKQFLVQTKKEKY